MFSYGYITGSNSTYRGCTLKASYGIMADATFENCQINGIISSFDTSTYKNCAFESVTVEAGFGGTIEVKMDVVIGETTDSDVVFHYGANILNSLAEKYPGADLTNRMWTVGGTAVATDAVFGL